MIVIWMIGKVLTPDEAEEMLTDAYGNDDTNDHGKRFHVIDVIT